MIGGTGNRYIDGGHGPNILYTKYLQVWALRRQVFR